MNLIVSAGGTGGHIYPALAIIKEFQKHEKDLNVLYIGTHNRMETKIIPEHNIPYEPIEIYGFSKSMIGRDIKNLGLIIKSYEKCIKVMKNFKPDVVIGVGGYVTFPVIMAAKKLKIKTVIHEQNCIPGKTNKFLCKGVDKIFVSFKSSDKYFKSDNVVYTGNPSGDNVYNLKTISKESLGIDKNKKLVLITSGSLGSSALNDKLIEFINNSDNTYEILMITGKNNYDNVLTKITNKSAHIIPYLDDQAGILKNVDVVISRAGASTLSEIINACVPSILVPSPYVANNHQYYNALEVHENKCAIMLEEKDLTTELLNNKVNELLNNKELCNEMKDNLKSYSTMNSSETIYNEVKRML